MRPNAHGKTMRAVPRTAFCPRPQRAAAHALLLLSLASLPAYAQATAASPQSQTATQAQAPTQGPLQPHTVRIRILNAQTNKPVTNERLNVALRADQIGSVAMATDKNGIILVDTGAAQTLRILANMYADCRPRGELYTDYPVSTIRSSGITTGNLCSSAHPDPKPGDLVLFEIPKTYIRTMGQPPVTNLPHSDENPHAPNP